jgi:hypothetical protein
MFDINAAIQRKALLCQHERTDAQNPETFEDAPVGGSTLLMKMKMAFSGLSLMRLRMTYTNCPTVRSAGTRYFFLSMSGMSLRSAFSQITYTAQTSSISTHGPSEIHASRANILGCGPGTWIGYAAPPPGASLEIRKSHSHNPSGKRFIKTLRHIHDAPNGCSFLNELIVVLVFLLDATQST